MKDLFMQAHDELIDLYLEKHPWMTWDQAYDVTADAAYDRMRDKYADLVDQARQRKKDEQL
jgi:hypothetical protein